MPTQTVGLTLKSTLPEVVSKRFVGILSEPLYCVATMLDARYKNRYFDADKKQGLPEMLHTPPDKMETDTVTVRTLGHRQTELELHCLTCMMKSWLRMK
jgi:hypothetical protein